METKLSHRLHIFFLKVHRLLLKNGPHLLASGLPCLPPSHDRATAKAVQEDKVSAMEEGLDRSQGGGGGIHELDPHQDIPDANEHTGEENTQKSFLLIEC